MDAPVVTPRTPKSHHPDYSRLTAYLQACQEQSVTLTFTQLEQEILFGMLPYGARIYPRWWSNAPHRRIHQNRAWLGAEWRAASVDLPGEMVIFERSNPTP
jgi:hypothetical protein